ncbi:MAG TPA: hemolysin [Clostridiales bacterium]|nr:hemolysin [Clostridiales bacterium]
MKQEHHGLYGVFVRRARDPLSSFTHLLGAIGSVFAAMLLAAYCRHIGGSGLRIFSVIVFGLSLTALYTASSVFHFYNHGNFHIQLRLRKLDHSMIYVLIAGSYTPFLICSLDIGAARSLMIIWCIALAGIAVKLLWMNAPRWLSTGFYLALGWSILAIPEALHAMPAAVIVFTALGGVAYSIGAVIYALKKPNFGTVWGFHEIFHLFILLGSALQVFALFLLLTMR